MRRASWRWYVFGAQAVVAYGRPRMTADVDVTVLLGDDSALELVRVLRENGFDTRFALDADFLSTVRLVPMLHLATGMPVDVVISQPGLQEEIWNRSRPVEIGGVQVPLVSVEDLVAMKILAGRRKDLEDVRGILLEQWDGVDFSLRIVRGVRKTIEDEGGRGRR
jgi:predicted nucleotidyltransferase